MKPWNTWYCVDCEEIFSSTSTYNTDMRCPSCMSSAIQSLSVYIQTTTDKESIKEIKINEAKNYPAPNFIGSHPKLNTGQILQTYIQKARDFLCQSYIQEGEVDKLHHPKRIKF